MKQLLILFLTVGILSGCTSYAKLIATHREEYKAEFTLDPRSPLDSSELKDLDFFEPNKRAKVEAVFVKTPDAQPFDLPTYSGITRPYRKWGVATFLWAQDSVSLALYESLNLHANPIYDDYLFLPFKDETNGTTTYGGGRYLNMSKADTEDGKLTIDFNLCYNPWCAYSDGYNCPIPPAENSLPFSMEAGERMYKGVHKEAK